MTRPRGSPIKVWVSPEERATIEALAASASLSRSAYLRAAGLNLKVRSRLDVEAVTELSKVNGQLGWLAELLKLWLEDKDHPIDVARTMKEFRELQRKSHEIMGRMMR